MRREQYPFFPFLPLRQEHDLLLSLQPMRVRFFPDIVYLHLLDLRIRLPDRDRRPLFFPTFLQYPAREPLPGTHTMPAVSSQTFMSFFDLLRRLDLDGERDDRFVRRCEDERLERERLFFLDLLAQDGLMITFPSASYIPFLHVHRFFLSLQDVDFNILHGVRRLRRRPRYSTSE